MRDLVTLNLRRLKTGWFWPLVLLALPNCALERNGLPNLDPGPSPQDAIMCDIEKFQGVGGRRCASAQDIVNGIELESAAVALVTGQQKTIGLDFSAAAFKHCGDGNPEAIDFQGLFPDGLAVCVNCGHSTPADPAGVCVAQCEDMIDLGEIQPNDPTTFCKQNARPSTNFLQFGCFAGACPGGVFDLSFKDPRRDAEKVIWDDAVNVMVNGNSLTKNAGNNANFDAGAVSDQFIFNGDGYVEFEAAELGKTHVAGLQLVPAGCTKPADCPDMVQDYKDISFAISLNANNEYYIFESGNMVMGSFDMTGAWGMYAANQRFRVTVTDKHDGTYDVVYAYIDPMNPCNPGQKCNPQQIHTHNVPATYPLRVDTSFRELNATLANVTIVRIQPQ